MSGTPGPTSTMFANSCLFMALCSGLFWLTSWPPAVLGPEFPNCVAARYDSLLVGVGCLSHRRVSCLFITTEQLRPGRAIWSERPVGPGKVDGHFCSFPVPGIAFPKEPTGFNVRLALDAIGWVCPYWLMTTLWATMYLKTRARFQFDLRHLLLTVTLFAIVAAMICWKLALICVLMLNVATALLLLTITVAAARAWFRAENAWWPVLRDDIADHEVPGRSGVP